MSLLKCPKCGEMFSDSYKECPFCLEDEEYYNGGKKAAGHRVQKQKSPSIAGPAMLLVVLLLVGFLGYTFLGDNIADLISGEKKPPVVNQDDDKGDKQDDPVKDPVVLTLDQTTLVLKAGDSATLTAGGADTVLWSSSDGSVVKVDENGNLTAQKEGSATITISAENASSAVCVVTVTPGAKDLILQAYTGTRDDFSMSVGGSVAMEVINEATNEEVTSGIQWATEDSSVATVSDDGVVHGEGSGKTTITATINGVTLSCIVRVS